MSRPDGNGNLRRMEMYFIGEKIYQKLEACDSYEEALEVVGKALLQIESVLHFPIVQDDIEKLLSLQIKRISRYDQKESQKELDKLKVTISSLNKSLRDITSYTITYLEKIKDKYGSDYPRRTKIKIFDEIRVQDVAEKQKVCWDRKEGFLGMNVKSGTTSFYCSAYDKIVFIRKDGSYQVIRVPEKTIYRQGCYLCGETERQDSSQCDLLGGCKSSMLCKTIPG